MPKEYFSHDYGTRHKKRLAALIHEHKMRGYGLFWTIVEMLHEDSTRWMDLDELTFISIHRQSGEPVAYIKKFVSDCIDRYSVFIQEENRFTTERVLRNIDMRLEISEQKSVAGKKGAIARWQKIAEAIDDHSTTIAPAMCANGTPMADDGKGKESKVKESKVKKYLRPKGLTASFEADPAEIKALKKEYDLLVDGIEGKTNIECWEAVKSFIDTKQPKFLEPFIDLWNIFAITHHLIAHPIRVTDHRRKKLEIRVREPGFDFIAALAAVKKSDFLKGKNERGWTVDFEFIIHSEENYTKILEGKYK